MPGLEDRTGVDDGQPRPGALGWVVAAGYTGSMLGPAAIGLLSDAAGLRTALLLVVVCTAAIAPLSGRVRTAVA